MLKENQHKICRTCGISLIVKQTKKSPSQLEKSYYYTAYYYCSQCKKMYLDDAFKIENNKTSLFSDSDSPVDVEIWTDGACSNNGRPNAKAAWAFVSHSASSGQAGRYEKADFVIGKQTNNTAESLAIYYALLWAVEKEYKRIRISSDSQITLHNLQKPLEKIKVNHDIFRKIFGVINENNLEVHYKKVLGHADDVNNNRADRLCNGLVGIK